jgi:acetyl/propionyl-CoA carboxylase alpha subunit
VSVELQLRSGSHTEAVTLVPDGDGYVATVRERTIRLTDIVAGPRSSVAGATVEELQLRIDGLPCRAVVARTRDRIHVAVAGTTCVFERVDDATAGGAAGAGSGSVVAPMPGKVVRVLVAPGDAVTAGQPLLVVEAMKMETTLAAEIDGTVAAVNAVAGAMVDAGAVLVEITAAA